MLRVYDNVVSADDLNKIKKMWDTVANTMGLVDKFYIDDQLHMERTVINDHFPDMYRFCKTLINFNIPNKIHYGKIIFTRVHIPSPTHVDVDEAGAPGFTVIIPLTFHDEIKTIVWKDKFDDNSKFSKFKDDFVKNSKSSVRLNSITKEANLSHLLEIDDVNIGEVMELDGYAKWQKGSIIVFDKTQVHCSSDFRQHLPFKDYVLVHTP